MSPERRQAIMRLLETRDQHLPEQRRRDPSPAGFVHQTTWRESCPDCLANGRVLKTCETCRGRGYLEHRRSRDPYATDVVMPYGWSADRHEARRELDAQIGRLEAQTRPPWTSAADELADANAHPEAWEIARLRMWANYDYGALDLALDALHRQHETCYHVMRFYILGYAPPDDPHGRTGVIQPWHREPSASMARVAELGLRFIDQLMPTPIRAPGMATVEVAA